MSGLVADDDHSCARRCTLPCTINVISLSYGSSDEQSEVVGVNGGPELSLSCSVYVSDNASDADEMVDPAGDTLPLSFCFAWVIVSSGVVDADTVGSPSSPEDDDNNDDDDDGGVPSVELLGLTDAVLLINESPVELLLQNCFTCSRFSAEFSALSSPSRMALL